MRLVAGSGNLLVGTTSNLARLQVRGTGATSSTTALRVENSNASASLLVRDDLTSTFQGVVTVSPISAGNTATIGQSAVNVGSVLSLSGYAVQAGIFTLFNENWGASVTFGMFNGVNSHIITGAGHNGLNGSRNGSVLRINNNISAITGSSDDIIVNIAPTYNISSSYSGSLRGLIYNPTFTTSSNFAIHRAIETTAGDILFRSGSNNLFFVSQSGNVGINTVTPSYRLDVNGTAFNTFQTNTPLLVDASSNNYRIANLINNSGYNSGAGTNNTFDIFSVGANPTSSGAGNNTPFFRVNLNGGNSGGYYGSAGSNNSLVQLNATTRASIIASAQNDGIALIGGTSLATLTTIAAGVNLNLRSDNNGAFAGGGINYYSSINGSLHSHKWFHNNTEQMRLSFGGDLIINATTSLARLHVRGAGATSSTTALRIENSNASASLTVLDNGFVGIGTGSAQYRLDVNGIARIGDQSTSGQLYIKGFPGSGQYLYLDDGSKIWSIIGGTNYSILENSTTRFVIREGGNVGIGTNNPQYTLHVSGSGNIFASNRVIAGGASATAADPDISTRSTIAGLFEPSYANLGFTSFGGEAGRIETANRYWNIGMTGGTAKLNVRGSGATSSTAGLRIENSNGTAALLVRDNGNVGIGTTTPSERLHIVASGSGTDVPLYIAGTNTKGGTGYLDFLKVENTGGVSTPKKFFRINNSNGAWEVVNDAYSTVIMALDDNGDMQIAGTLTQNSDESLKTNIQTIPNALEKTLQLRGVEYDRISTNKHEIGLIAQEVEQVFPELVSEANGIKSVAYSNVVSILIESIKELKQEIDILREQVNKK
jgi:hypothetical protein